MAKEHANFYQLDDPWDLPPYFLLRKNKWKSTRTYSGYWKEKEEELTAIRCAGESSSSSASPSYVGVRKILEFYLKDGTNGGKGTKTDWIIHEYYDLRKDDDGEALFLQEDVVLRKVFKKCKNKTDQESSVYRQVESCLYRQIESCVKAYKEQKQAYKELEQVHCSHRDIILGTEGACRLTLEVAKLHPLIDSLENQIKKPCPSDQYHILNQIATCVETIVKLVMELQNKDLGDDCHPDGKSDNVWKHFTKIRSANDPDEVYAACHRCDKLLKAHPKKHGISHLKRHIHTCSSCTNPSTDEDREMLHRLRTVINNPYEQQKMDDKLNCQEDLTQLDPWDLNLTPWYVTRSLNRQTAGGHWKEINKDFTAIRMDEKVCWKDIDKEIAVMQMDHQLQVQAPQPQYIGLRRTLQFHHQDGRKVDWMMLEYQQLDDMESPVLLLQGCLVIRKVFHYDKDAVASTFTDLDRLLNADDGDEEYFNGEGVNTDSTTPSDNMDTPCSGFPLDEGMNTETTTSRRDRKRKRTVAASRPKSEVWMHFTKIHDTDCAVVYVVCHTCDRGYTSGHPKNGTSHLRRHTKSCASKHPNTGKAKDATTEWETEIWPWFLLLKTYGEHQPSGAMC